MGIHHHLGGLMFGLGIRLPKKARNKTRTLHVSFVCALVYGCVFGVYDMLYVLTLFVCLVIST